jgi:cell division protein FtsL/phage tail protein X
MKRILTWIFILSFSLTAARAQDDATQQQINKLTGQIQDALDAQALQAKRITALEKEISELHDKSSQPGAADTANADDLKKLAEQVQEVDKKRQADRELILKEIEKLGKVAGGTASRKSPVSAAPVSTDNSTANTGDKQNGYWQVVGSGDTISTIVKAYRAKGIKVTADQILKANPGLDANKLYVGKKIFIPAPAQ